MLTSYALIYPNIRFSFKHSGNISNKISKRKINATFNNNNVEWHSIICNSTMESIKHLFGNDLTSQLQNVKKVYPIYNEGSDNSEEEENIDENIIEIKPKTYKDNIEINAILYKPGVDPEKYWRSSTDRIFFYVNKRPIQLSLMSTFKEILKLIKQKSFQFSSSESSGNKKYPFIFLDVTLPTNTIDINIEPSKMKIMFHHPQKIIDLVDEITDEVYPPPKLEIATPLIFKPMEQLNIVSDKSSFSTINEKISDVVKEQHLENISFLNKEMANNDINLKEDNNIINTVEISDTKLIDNNINNFILKRSSINVFETELMERKQNIKRRKLNLSTIEYTTEKFVDIKSCKNNYRKYRLNKNKAFSLNAKIIGFLNNNVEGEEKLESENENIDKYDQFWVIKENRQLILGSWKRINELMIYQKLLKTFKIPSKEKIPPIFYNLSPEDIVLSKSFIYEKSENDNVKKIMNSFITLNGYEAWFHKYNNTIEIRKTPNISDEYNYFGSIDDFKNLITNNVYMNESIVTQTETLNEYQRPSEFNKFLKSLLPLWCSPNIPLNDISSSYICPKLSKENLKEILRYVLSDINNNITTSLKYEGLISPKSKKHVAKSIYKI